MNYSAVGIGGIMGSVIRYLISLHTITLWNGGFPFGTFMANMCGCFLLGLLTGINEKKEIIPKMAMLGIGTGMIGSLTTFSTFSVETLQLYETVSIYAAGLYAMLSAVLGLLLAWTGFLLGKKCSAKVVDEK